MLSGAVYVLGGRKINTAYAKGTEEEQMVLFRRVRDEIKERISDYVNSTTD